VRDGATRVSAPEAQPQLAALARSDEDWLLADLARRFVGDQGLLGHSRAVANGRSSGDQLTAALDRVLASLGWSELLVPKIPGAPPAIRRAAIVLQELGTELNPTPLTSSLLAAHARWHYGDVPRTREETTALALDLATPGIGAFSYAATGDGSGSISGTGGLLAGELARADSVVCEARDDDGRRVHVLVSIADLGPEAIVEQASLDLTRTYVTLDLAATPARRLEGPRVDGERLAGELWLSAVLLYCAETLGALGRLFGATIRYARERIAFGRPVASYQAIKHRLADASLHIETASALLEYAVDEIESASPTACTAVSALKAYLSTISVSVAEECMQFFGAVGYTWEFDAHLYLRRLVTQRCLLGSPEWHQRAVYRAQSGTGATRCQAR
jgi:alkylation response protein AidB-like acyl-CoA dehydrogenase